MHHAPSPPARPTLGPPPFGDLDLTLPEVKQLRSFLDGSIMDPFVRHHLWRSWGFCPRHTWAFGTADIEIRSTRPFPVGILYEDLTSRAARLVASRRPPARMLRQLRSHDHCFTWGYLEIAGAGDRSYADLQARANRRERTSRLLAQSRPVWEGRTCPHCRGGAGPPCRPHLLEGAAGPHREIGSYLAVLARRLGALVKSFTWNGPEATVEDQVSWVEALGWFGGWEFPFRALEERLG